MTNAIEAIPSPDVLSEHLLQESQIKKKVAPEVSRIVSLDAFRGFALSIGFFAEAVVPALSRLPVSDVRDVLLQQLTHTPWNGISFLDVGWPAFLCIAGISLSLALDRRIDRGVSRLPILKDLLYKSSFVLLFAFYFQGGFSVPIDQVNFAAVFFIYALVVLVAGFAKLYLGFRGIAILVGMLVAGFSIATVWGTQRCFGTIYQDPSANLDDVVKQLLGSHYLYKYLWFFPRMAIPCLCGLLFARLYRTDVSPHIRVTWLLGIGFGLLNISWVLDMWVPINKVLWTTSFALCALGITCFFLAAFCQLIEVWQIRSFAMPWIVFGVNPLLAWSVYELVPFSNYADRVIGYAFEPMLGVYNGILLAFVRVGLCWLLFYQFYRRKIFIRF